MKILYVITKANWGGAQRYVYDLACAAQERGHEVVVAYGDPGVLTEHLAGAGIRGVPLASLTRDVSTKRDMGAYRELKALLRREKPDIVHLNSAKAAGLGALAARSVRTPEIIFTAHGWAFNEDRPWWQRAFIWMLSGVTVLLAHKTICVSEAVRRDISLFPCIKKKLVVIHNGVACAPQLPRPEARAAILSNHRDTYWIGMVSELHTTKRVGDGIRAFAKIKDDFPEAIFVGIGEGQERVALEKLIDELGMRDRVFLPGFVADARTKLSAFDVLLHTSRSEALAYTILEAGCASLPVVATRVGGIPEIVKDGENGFLVPAFRPDIAAERLRTVMHNQARAKEMGEKLHTTVTSSFSLSHMTDKTLGLYRSH